MRAARLQVLTTNERAIKFYERLGFLSIGSDKVHITMERPA
jgi:ribosomal protein S18 acetylase RimI-like enzyme